MSQPDEPDALTRHEEELQIQARTVDAGTIRAHKHVITEHVQAPVTRQIEDYDHLDYAKPTENDSGRIETLDDGSVSIPILEEELVITKRLVVRERVILRKRVTTSHETIEADLRRERLTVEGDEPSPSDAQS